MTKQNWDWDAASSEVCSAYFPHRLRPLTRATAANVAVDGVDLGPVRIAHIAWGATVSVETTHPGGYAVNAPLSGHLESTVRGSNLVATPDDATIYPPDTSACISRWPDTCLIVGVRIDTDYLNREMSRILERPAPVPDHLDLASSAGAEWLGLVRSLATTPCTHQLVNQQLCGAIVSSFILAVGPDEEPRAARPRVVRRVLEELHADPARPWTASDMAAVSGVSLRRLQESFRTHLGVSPREYLLELRLARVREELRDTASARTVTDVALDWGFTHTGRFAQAYRRQYGESPSQTRRT